ncbi:MAG: 2-oxo acid dehydrogenase subunit E2 [Lewinellaceae bacterium]|nr:2-oxo acid dehydrogenase subunit E2 [Lewinellaceae bacterium]
MAKIELLMPKMGESIIEATILKWLKKPGDTVENDETILEVATDKVDSEIPSPTNGVISEILFNEGDVVPIGSVIAYIQSQNGAAVSASPAVASTIEIENAIPFTQELKQPDIQQKNDIPASSGDNSRFYSPLVRSIAQEENVTLDELDQIQGSGSGGRVNKKDILEFVKNRSQVPLSSPPQQKPSVQTNVTAPSQHIFSSTSGNTEIIEMDRMRKLIADHMVMSKQTSPHVTSFVEPDVTNLVKWREQNKGAFKQKYGENLTFTPLFIEAVVRAIKDFPLVNVSVDGQKIIVKKDINVGMAAALPSGNLIVPVVKNADMLSLAGLAKTVNDLALRARNNKLKPEDIQDGTFTLTNVGTFGNLMGTPIINQPQVAILATGVIVKKPAVLETEYGDIIAIRQKMYLSMSYDHRVVDGALGGAFIKRVSDYLENFDINRTI